MMNRELRRAQSKMDKKAEREKEERREARQRKLQQARERRAARREEAKKRAAARGSERSAEAQPGTARPKRGGRAGRFSAALMMATVFFIVLQSSVPPQPGDNELLRSVTGAGFYLLFGYFSTLWMLRRDTPRPLTMTWVTGGMLLFGVEVAKYFQQVVPFDPLMVGLAVPGLIGGAYLGRLVFENTPS